MWCTRGRWLRMTLQGLRVCLGYRLCKPCATRVLGCRRTRDWILHRYVAIGTDARGATVPSAADDGCELSFGAREEASQHMGSTLLRSHVQCDLCVRGSTSDGDDGSCAQAESCLLPSILLRTSYCVLRERADVYHTRNRVGC